jgi:aminoglycoside phosphotransferase (APT) family kinase protein
VTFADGTALELLLKDLARPHDAKPAFLHDPAREIETYRRILAPSGVGAPAFHGAIVNGRFWLLLEKVEGTELWQVGDVGVWRAVARWLARMHSTLAQYVDEPHLLRHDADSYRLWLRRAQARVDGLEPVAEVHDAVVERLRSLPQTVIHGEFYASNVIVQGSRVCAVDWETAAVGPGLLDLAALTTGWTGDEYSAIVRAYGDADEEALECCRLQLAVRWLGWSRDWMPPGEHARDWRADALAAAERLRR